ncbi:MAG: uncharacterized protein HW411_779 [Gammaproteobacteria bacterium]|nr:uncharacterized protein [Gammaproteobacteria bacterium]
MTEQPRGQWKNKAIPIVLFLIFLSPVLGSWFLAFYTDFMRDSSGTLQHGMLIDPPQLLEDISLTDPVQAREIPLHGKWTMFTVVKAECGNECKENLYRMRQISLAMGKEMHRVQRVVLLDDVMPQNSVAETLKDYPGQLVLSAGKMNAGFMSHFAAENKKYDHAIFLIDPLGYLMMCYPPDTDPVGIIKDMKRLLRNSSIG